MSKYVDDNRCNVELYKDSKLSVGSVTYIDQVVDNSKEDCIVVDDCDISDVQKMIAIIIQLRVFILMTMNKR